MSGTSQRDLERAFIDKFCGSFNKDFQKILDNVGFSFTVDGEPQGVLKLRLSVQTQKDYVALKRKWQALRYRLRKLAPPVKQVIILRLFMSERIPTKHKGMFVRQTLNIPSPCLIIDTETGTITEITVDVGEFLNLPALNAQQAEQLFTGLFGKSNQGGQV
ncbi:MAG: hypothetical protein M3O33_04520 [Cyanobacteriota bacterium]|nr:hypothetical protein [Cyanobacteriota bacterium]